MGVEEEIFHLLVYSPTARAGPSPSQEPELHSDLSILFCLSRLVSRKLGQKQSPPSGVTVTEIRE